MATGGKITRQEFEAQNDEAKRLARWFQYQQDAYDGAGGFAAVYGAQVLSTSGARTTIPDWASASSYLDKHEREGMEEYRQRRAASRYTNLLRHGLTHWLGMLLRPSVGRQKGIDARVDAFYADCDGTGTPWDDRRAEIMLRTILLRGQPIMVSRPDDTGAQSEADSKGLPYIWTPRARDLWEWDRDERNRWNWVKLVDQVIDRSDPLRPADTYQRCRIYTREWWQTWQLRGDEKEPRIVPLTEGGGGLINLDEVPLVLSLFDDPTGDDLFGWTPADELGQTAREDFNTISRLIEIFEKATFPMLGWPVNPGDQRTIDEIAAGVSTVAPIPMEGGNKPGWITADPTPANQHVDHHGHLRDDAYKALGLETVLATTAQAMSGVSRQYAFAHLNAALASQARRMANVERQILRLVLKYYNEKDDRIREILDAVKIDPPVDFDVRDEMSEMAQIQAALDLPGLDSVTQVHLLKRARSIVAPKMDETETTASDKELDALLKAEGEGEPTDEEMAAAAEAARKQAEIDALKAPAAPDASKDLPPPPPQ
jgi:hypothetical protein